ncbi:TPA: nucleotide exchange factor GrpE [Candidatus Sumerlaeota bacterium]|jgi:molecular chaperone GrpE|nr:nucleotide exchange factor GrpE [Candidatus Sumerlaeota bacterium]
MPDFQLETLSPDELRERYLRTLADLDNVRKRGNAQMQASVLHERHHILASFLEVVDNLERAMSLPHPAHAEWARGIQGIHQQMLSLFLLFGVEPFESLGQMFDPVRHEAVAQVTVPGAVPNTITDVLLKGYQFKDGTILRPAKVRVVAS